MKRILLLAFVVLIALVWLNRQRVYVRDPLAAVYRNNVKQAGVQVYINYSYDILMEKDEEPGAYRMVVQDWDRMPATPVILRCVRSMACLTEADRVPTFPTAWTGKGQYDPKVMMSNHEVSFVAGDGSRVLVELR
jgi:hypothetical protein